MSRRRPFVQRAFSRIARWTYFALGVLFVLAFFVQHLSERWFWWVEFAAIGLPYLALLLVALSLPVWRSQRWTYRGLHLTLLLLVAFRFAPTGLPAAPSDGDLSLLTFNAATYYAESHADAGERLARLAAATDADVIGLQEVNTWQSNDGRQGHVSPPAALLIDSLRYRLSLPDASGWGGHWTGGTLSNVELLTQDAIHLPTSGGQKRTAIRTAFRWQGREAVHYNVHLESHGGRKPWNESKRSLLSPGTWLAFARTYRERFRVRNAQARLLRDALAAETRPVIVSGDFNATPHNTAFRLLADGLQDAYRAAGTGWGATYHRRLPLFRIDHVLASPDWHVVRATVPTPTFSDHHPVLVHLRWRN